RHHRRPWGSAIRERASSSRAPQSPAPRARSALGAFRTVDVTRGLPGVAHRIARRNFSTRRAASAGARLVEIHDDLVGHRIALACEDEPACHLVVLEREIDVHVDFAFDQAAATRRAYAAL